MSRTKSARSRPIRPSIDDFTPYLSTACKVVGSSSDSALLQRCEAAMQQALGTQATAVRSQSYYLDVTPPGYDKGTFVQRWRGGSAFRPTRSPPSATCRTTLPMFEVSGLSFAMGNATDDVKKQATHVTARTRTKDLPRAMEMILSGERRLRAYAAGSHPEPIAANASWRVANRCKRYGSAFRRRGST